MAGPWMLSASTLVPPGHPLAKMSLPKSFAVVGAAWRKALESMGITTEMVRPENLESKRMDFNNNGLEWVCYAGLSHGELTDVRNRKLVGLAQIRKKTGVAVVSGILTDRPDWETLTHIWLGESTHDTCSQLDRLTASTSQLLSDQQRLPERELVNQLSGQLRQLDLHS